MTHNNSKIHVLLVDDHPIVRTGYRILLDNINDIEVVAEAGSGNEAYEYFINNPCNVVVMDLSMPDINGIDAIKKITNHNPNSNILVISMFEEIVYIEQALSAGAKGYLTKNCNYDEIVEAIRILSTGKKYISKNISEKLNLKNIRGDNSGLSCLSTREFAIFCSLVEGLDGKEIAEQMSLKTKTVSNYITQIKNKLECKTLADIVHLAARNNIINI